LKRAIQQYLENTISEAIIAGNLPSDATITLSLNEAGDGVEVKWT
jgi:ATP-dependent Clp protease ATP-binding subunit ClpA